MISVAAELAEMHPQTLRMYEARGLITPKRSPKNTRLYSYEDVERLRRIQRMTAEEGLNLAGVETRARARGAACAAAARARKDAQPSARSCSARCSPRWSGSSAPSAPRSCPTAPTTRSNHPRREDAPIRIPWSGGGAARRSGRRIGIDAARPVHDQVPGGGCRLAASSPPSIATPRSPRPTCCLRCSTPGTASSCRSCRSSAPTRPAIRQRARPSVDDAAHAERRAEPEVRPVPALRPDASARREGDGGSATSTSRPSTSCWRSPTRPRASATLLPDRDALAKAIAEVRGPHRVTSPNPEDTCRRWRNSAAT